MRWCSFFLLLPDTLWSVRSQTFQQNYLRLQSQSHIQVRNCYIRHITALVCTDKQEKNLLSAHNIIQATFVNMVFLKWLTIINFRKFTKWLMQRQFSAKFGRRSFSLVEFSIKHNMFNRAHILPRRMSFCYSSLSFETTFYYWQNTTMSNSTTTLGLLSYKRVQKWGNTMKSGVLQPQKSVWMLFSEFIYICTNDELWWTLWWNVKIIVV